MDRMARSYGRVIPMTESIRSACARGLTLAPVAALLLSVAILLLGNGLLGAALMVVLALIAIVGRQSNRPNEARAILWPSTPMLTGALDAMIQTQGEVARR